MKALDRTLKIPLTDRTTTVKYALVHAAYWVLITGFFLYEKRYLLRKANLPYFTICVVSRIGLLIAIAYLCIHYFLPRYLMAKRYLSFFAAILASILAYLVIQTFVDFYLYGFVVGPHNNSRFVEGLSYNFFSTIWYIGLMIALKLSIDWYEQQRIVQKITVEKLQAELNFLRAQVNPHFLFNSLNNLYALTLKKSDLAPDMVLKLADMMEYMLYDSDDDRVSLEKEISYLQNYIELEKIRCGDHSDIILQINGHPNGQEIAPLLLLPLVENAFKHGVGKQADRAWLHGTLTLNPTSIEMMIENNKPVIHPKPQKGGVGLSNLRKRLELLYPGHYTLQTEDQFDRYKAELSISFAYKS